MPAWTSPSCSVFWRLSVLEEHSSGSAGVQGVLTNPDDHHHAKNPAPHFKAIRKVTQGGDGPKYENRTPLSTSWNYGYYIIRSITPCVAWEVVLGQHSLPAATVSSALQTLNDNAAFRKLERPVVLVRRTKW
ncbi:hypothetical protein TgHK011_005896 [Trichoderma gracile]|nr:hypothetical protein TgHK011_005896 [Trichoderma gracile]